MARSSAAAAQNFQRAVEMPAGSIALLGFTSSGPDDLKLDEVGVELVPTTDGSVWAIVAPDLDFDDITESLVSAHEALIRVAHQTTVLPVRIGTVVPAGPVDCDIDAISAALARVDGNTEARIRGRYDEDMFLDAISGDLPRPGKTTDLDSRVRLGEEVSRIVEDRRQSETKKVIDAVDRFIDAHVQRDVTEFDLCDISVLIAPDKVQKVEDRLRKLVDSDMPYARFELVAPLPTYSFVEPF